MVEFKLTNGYSLMLTTEANEQAKKEREAK